MRTWHASKLTTVIEGATVSDAEPENPGAGGKRGRARLAESEEEERHFGILDGGNTNEQINRWRESLNDDGGMPPELRGTFVNVQVLIPKLTEAQEPSSGAEDLLNDIKEARNTSVQVKEKSLADARRHFDRLKTVLEGEPYYEAISWHEGDKGSIDALDVISLLVMYYPEYCEEFGEPYGIYGHKARALDVYLSYAADEPDRLDAWIQIVPMQIRLFDTIHIGFPEYYRGHFGKITVVRIYDEAKFERGSKRYRKTPPVSRFMGSEMKYSYPVGWIYPVFAAFRVLVEENKDSGAVSWKEDPVKFWQRHGDRLIEQFRPHMVQLDYAPKKVASSLTCYQAMRHAVTDCYKDELLASAGITV